MENTKSFNRKTVIVFAFFSISLLVLGCQKKNEQAPFFDGLYLRYYEVFAKSQSPENIIWTRKIEYRFKQLEDGSFHVSQEINTKRGKKLKKDIEPTLYPQAGEDLTIDKKGIVLKGGDGFINFIEGFPSSLWLPFDKRKEGTEVIDKVRKVGEKITWDGREAWPVKGIIGDIHYYDVNTGFLIGVENISGKLKMTLVDTNLEALKATLSEKSR